MLKLNNKKQKLTKLKHITAGIIIGATAMATPSIASEIKEYILYKADYKIVVNGQPYSNDELPILNYKGVTYTPLKAIGELLNSNVRWNAKIGQVEIRKRDDEKVEQSNQTSTKSSENNPTTENINYQNYYKVRQNDIFIKNKKIDIRVEKIGSDGFLIINEDTNHNLKTIHQGNYYELKNKGIIVWGLCDTYILKSYVDDIVNSN